jgi:hypothetical protein
MLPVGPHRVLAGLATGDARQIVVSFWLGPRFGGIRVNFISHFNESAGMSLLE